MVLSTANMKVIVSRLSLQVVTIASYRSYTRNLIFGCTVESNFGKKNGKQLEEKKVHMFNKNQNISGFRYPPFHHYVFIFRDTKFKPSRSLSSCCLAKFPITQNRPLLRLIAMTLHITKNFAQMPHIQQPIRDFSKGDHKSVLISYLCTAT